MSREIIIPRSDWHLRWYQKDAWRAGVDDGKSMALAWHRRAGKDELLLNGMAVRALKRPASYAYMFPETTHARRSMWNAVNPHTGKRRILETFPQEILAKPPNETEMRLEFVNGSNLILFGSDNYDQVVGAAFAGMASSEHALAHPSAYAFFSPMLLENKGFFWAISTPRGRNHFKKLLDYALAHPRNWFGQQLSITQTKALSEEDLAEELAKYISQWGFDEGTALFNQEYHVDFNAAILGSFYAREMAAVRSEGRITDDLDAINAPVHRAWDLGVKDDTSIWFFQVVGTQVFILDCYVSSGAGVDHYAEQIAKRREEHGWQDGIDFVPHDARVKEWGTGRTRVETMQQLGLNPQVVPMATVSDGVNAARKTLPRCVFHSRCDRTDMSGVAALEQYRREWDDEKKTFKANAVHDWTSHPADAFRYLSMAWRSAPKHVISAPEPEPPSPHHVRMTPQKPQTNRRISL